MPNPSTLLDEKLKINGDLFGSLLAYSYLCSVKTYVLTTPLSTKDQYGREIVDPAYGITIPFPQCDVHLIHEE